MTLFVGDDHRSLFERLYKQRGAIEHLREHELLKNASRESRLGLRIDDYVAEYACRCVMASIVENQDLWHHFGTAEALDRFWELGRECQREIWGNLLTQLQPSTASTETCSQTTILGCDHEAGGLLYRERVVAGDNWLWL